MTVIEQKLDKIIKLLEPTYVNVGKINEVVSDIEDDMIFLKRSFQSINERLTSIEQKIK
jgi:hypothetical protein